MQRKPQDSGGISKSCGNLQLLHCWILCCSWISWLGHVGPFYVVGCLKIHSLHVVEMWRVCGHLNRDEHQLPKRISGEASGLCGGRLISIVTVGGKKKITSINRIISSRTQSGLTWFERWAFDGIFVGSHPFLVTMTTPSVLMQIWQKYDLKCRHGDSWMRKAQRQVGKFESWRNCLGQLGYFREKKSW